MYKILLVEDDCDIRELICDYFHSKSDGLGLAIVKSIAQLHSYNLKTKLSDNIITFTISFA